MTSDQVNRLIENGREKVRVEGTLDHDPAMPTSTCHTEYILRTLRNAMLTEDWNMVAHGFALVEENYDVQMQFEAHVWSGGKDIEAG